MAPRQLDLHLIVFSVLFTPLTDEQAAAFRHGYGLVELHETRLVRYACVRALEDLVATAHGLDIELVEVAERGEVGQREGSVGHVEVFRTGSLRTSIIGGPRPRSSPTAHTTATPSSAKSRKTDAAEERPVHPGALPSLSETSDRQVRNSEGTDCMFIRPVTDGHSTRQGSRYRLWIVEWGLNRRSSDQSSTTWSGLKVAYCPYRK
ncbi:hypothetical protein DEI92_15450 [Curtobacterium sp. MCBD17_034]|nr:hypothetical protein DEI92_15450 [Curtobacterium sp. MCBD17_034]PZM32945.1 hypothetical protein DEI90_15145 [Curtobacterium sp. MCBD17_031]